MTKTNRRVFLRQRSEGRMPVLADFGVEDVPLPPLQPGEVRVAVETLTVDAWIRTTLSSAGMHDTAALGSTIQAFGVGQVIASAAEGFQVGDWAHGMLCAQTIAQLPAAGLSRIEPEPGIPLSAHVGALGITTGLTAWVGLIAVGEVKAGDVVVVSGAAGAVGSCAVLLAKARGARVIGIAGGPEKCAYVAGELGADHAIDYRAGDVAGAIAVLAPGGIDVFFDNVGGEVLDAALDNLRPDGGARVVICGAISQYENLDKVQGPSLYLRLAERNASMRGFVVTHHAARFDEARAEIAGLIRSGRMGLREHVIAPIDRFGEALLLLFGHGHIGNLVVRDHH